MKYRWYYLGQPIYIISLYCNIKHQKSRSRGGDIYTCLKLENICINLDLRMTNSILAHATPTSTSRSKGQKSKSRGGGILWRPPSRTACFDLGARPWAGIYPLLGAISTYARNAVQEPCSNFMQPTQCLSNHITSYVVAWCLLVYIMASAAEGKCILRIYR